MYVYNICASWSLNFDSIIVAHQLWHPLHCLLHTFYYIELAIIDFRKPYQIRIIINCRNTFVWLVGLNKFYIPKKSKSMPVLSVTVQL